MRPFFVLLCIGTIATSGYFFVSVYAPVCDTPFRYRLGEFDVRFNISKEEAKQALLAAEAVWEKPTGRELFSYDETATFPINFIFDDRQERTLAEEAQRQALDTKEATSAKINEAYTALTKKYAELETIYKVKVSNYEKKLASFNATVATYNAEGGAPADMFAKLEATKKSLKREEVEIDRQAKVLATMVDDINELSDQGNRTIEQYNQSVQTYNKNFGHGEEFTQGDYKGESITIYKFSDVSELTTVLAHEFGHALSVPHVEGSSSIMYYLLEEQPKNLQTSPEDMAAFAAVCTQKSGLFGFIDQFIKTMFKK